MIALSALALRRLSLAHRDDHLVWLGALASAPWGIALILGQPASLLLASWLLALWAFRSERDLLAGLAWSILLVKPHFALAPLAFVLVRRRMRALAGMLLGACALVVISLPAGLLRWPEWLHSIVRAAGDIAHARVPLWKQHTLFSFVRSVVPDATIAWIVWAAIALVLGVLVLVRVRRRNDLRAGALLVLATIALAPYAYFYDALLLVVPAAALWLEPTTYARRTHRIASSIAALTFAWQHIGFFVLQRGPSIAGLLVTLWLVAELGSAHHGIGELDRKADPEPLELGREVGR
jgi:hypothetical protein